MIIIIRFLNKAKLSRMFVEFQKFDWVLLIKSFHVTSLLLLGRKSVALCAGRGLDSLPRKGAPEQVQEHIGKRFYIIAPAQGDSLVGIHRRKGSSANKRLARCERKMI